MAVIWMYTCLSTYPLLSFVWTYSLLLCGKTFFKEHFQMNQFVNTISSIVINPWAIDCYYVYYKKKTYIFSAHAWKFNELSTYWIALCTKGMGRVFFPHTSHLVCPHCMAIEIIWWWVGLMEKCHLGVAWNFIPVLHCMHYICIQVVQNDYSIHMIYVYR